MKKILTAIVCVALVLCVCMATALAGTSIPSSSKKTTGAYNGTFNSLGETPVYYTNYNVKPTSTGMSMWVTGKMNVTGATSNFRSGTGLMGSSTEIGSTKLYSFSDTQVSRNNTYTNSFNTANYYWASFNLVDRNNANSVLVGTFTFQSN